MSAARAIALSALFAVGACAAPQGPTPTLAPRAAESIDPRVPVVANTVQRPVDPTLTSRLAALISKARQSESAFVVAAGECAPSIHAHLVADFNIMHSSCGR